MDTKTFFSNLPARAEKNAAKMAGMNATYKFDITGAGTWVVKIENGKLSVSEGDGAAQCTVTVAPTDFEQIIGGALNAQMAFMSGKLKIAGDMGLAMKLGAVL